MNTFSAPEQTQATGLDAGELVCWELFHHQADVGIRGVGRTREEAFIQAALAVTAIVTDPSRVAPTIPVWVSCKGAGSKMLFMAWINAIIREMSARGMVFSRFEIDVAGRHLGAVIAGEPIDPSRHKPAAMPKGATMTDLRVSRHAGLWLAQCIVDV